MMVFENRSTPHTQLVEQINYFLYSNASDKFTAC